MHGLRRAFRASVFETQSGYRWATCTPPACHPTHNISTYLGNRFHPKGPRIDHIALKGITRGLAYQCRKQLRHFMLRDGAGLNRVLRVFLRVSVKTLQTHCAGALLTGETCTLVQ